ncbi:MAG: hypothetical protein AABX24_01790 [Nanoarchaeota archaeon]
MAGLTYTPFRPGDFCYVVVYTPIPPRYALEAEFLEGMVKEVNHVPKEMPPDHPLWRYSQVPPKMVQSICAIVTSDPSAALRHPTDSIKINQEPGRNYLVVHPREYVHHLTKQMREQIEQAGKQIEKLGKMNKVQAERIRGLEEKLQQCSNKD